MNMRKSLPRTTSTNNAGKSAARSAARSIGPAVIRRATVSGRLVQGTAVQRDRQGDVPWKLIGWLAAILFVVASLGARISLPQVSLPEMSLPDFSASQSSYENRYEVRKVGLSSTSRGTRSQWTVRGQVMNLTNEQISGPRLRIELVRADNTIAAQGELDYTSRSLREMSGVSFTYQLETAAGEALSARVTPLAPERTGD